MTDSAPPCSDPEHDLFPQSRRHLDPAKRVRGSSFGSDLLYCTACYNRRYWRAKKEGLLRRQKRTRAGKHAVPYAHAGHEGRTPSRHHAPASAAVPGDVDALTPADASRWIRQVWGRPDAAMILTSGACPGAIEETED